MQESLLFRLRSDHCKLNARVTIKATEIQCRTEDWAKTEKIDSRGYRKPTQNMEVSRIPVFVERKSNTQPSVHQTTPQHTEGHALSETSAPPLWERTRKITVIIGLSAMQTNRMYPYTKRSTQFQLLEGSGATTKSLTGILYLGSLRNFFSNEVIPAAGEDEFIDKNFCGFGRITISVNTLRTVCSRSDENNIVKMHFATTTSSDFSPRYCTLY